MFKYLTQRVHNRGTPPESFIDELIHFGKTAKNEIFEPNNVFDVYSSVFAELGPYSNIIHRKAVMLECLRVLAGFESSWDWKEGRDITNRTSVTADTIESGAWQVSANSLNFGDDLKKLVRDNINTLDGWKFQELMKTNHQVAIEYAARLLRHTVNHNGPVKRKEINPFLSRQAVEEFKQFISH